MKYCTHERGIKSCRKRKGGAEVFFADGMIFINLCNKIKRVKL